MRPEVDLVGKRVLVVGLARTGVAASLFGARHGATVTGTDEKPEAELAETSARLRAAGVALALGGHHTEIFLKQDLIIVSPGVPANLPPLEQAHARGIPVWSELELAWRFLRGKLIAITGSNGKTTTTALVAHILKAAAIPTLVGGNIGTPLLALVENSTAATVTVAEVSSFQLETISAFRPEIGVLLNLTPDHIDRHGSFESYASAKMRLFANQLESDYAVLNADDPEVAQRAPLKPHACWFSRSRRVARGAFVQSDRIIFRTEGSEETLLKRSEVPLRGEHNLENVLAAAISARLAGASAEAIAKGVQTFAGVEHRLEFVAEVGGVSYFNDSKATNVDATLKAIAAFSEPFYIILGGKDKGVDYTPLAEALRGRARLALLIGAAAEKIAAHLGDSVPMERVGTLERAVRRAAGRARPGEAVLLAPACASFDQFENFEHRGRIFKELVRQLGQEAAAASAVRKG